MIHKENKNWFESYFENQPLIGCLAFLNTIKLQVAQAQFLFVEHYYIHISSDLIKLIPKVCVIAKNNIVKVGSKYQAEIVSMGVVPNNDGYLLIGKVNLDSATIEGKADTLKIENGIAKYIIVAEKPGTYSYSGIYITKDWGSRISRFPFKTSYKVVKNDIRVRNFMINSNDAKEKK